MPQGKLTRSQFINTMRELLDEMEEDHEEYTGTTENEKYLLTGWIADLVALYMNTR